MLFFYFFAVIQLLFGYRSLRGGIDFLNYFKKELSDEKPEFQPLASIIIPCRGIDTDLEENLRSLFLQLYERYEIIFVVDDIDDESIPVIQKLIEKGKYSRLVIAGKAINSGQKVHNLRNAVLEISDESQILVFVDSDARPKETWLRDLVAPLYDPRVGCSTGYRWFVQKSGGFSTHLRAVWNASIASQLGENRKSNFCWGGSMAIRRDNFENLKIREKWNGTLSDDFAVTKALSDAKMPIYFVPQCLTASVEDSSFRELLEFTTRQMKITRTYYPRLWIVSLISALLFSTIFWGGFLLLFFTSGVNLWITSFLISLTFLLGVGKAWLRLSAVKLILTNYHNEIDKQLVSQLILWVFTPLLFLYNNFCALISKKIVWRGIQYELKSANETVIIGRIDEK